MSASIKHIFQCPRCENDVTSFETVMQCPICGLPLGKMEAEPYTAPYTLSEQHLKFKDSLKYAKALAELPPDKALSILNDALNIVENIGGTKSPSEDIRNMVKMAMRIGRIASAYDHFIQAGGKHAPALLKQQQEPNEPETVRPKKAAPTALFSHAEGDLAAAAGIGSSDQS
jgi:hypothetical protein